jgi:hypothetical protein
VVGATVAIKCTSGAGFTSTDAAGNYSIVISGVSFPCVLRASGGMLRGLANAQTLISFAVTGPVANITPLTHLQAARLFGRSPELAFDEFNAVDQARVTTSNANTALSALQTELGRLGIVLPSNLDPVTTPFAAIPTDPVDQTLELLMVHLGYAAKTLGQAAQEFAAGPFNVRDGVAANCRPGVIAGFSGMFNDALVQVPPDPSGPGGGDGSSGGDGAGAGGSLGQFRNTLVVVEREDGTEIGRAITDNDKGMVTIVPCLYNGPARIRFIGERSDANYYDEALSSYVPFAGQSLCAVVPSITRNIGVTPLTNAACGYLDMLSASAAKTALKQSSGRRTRAAWSEPARIDTANNAVLAEFRRNFPSVFELQDITRLPVVLNGVNGNAPGTLSNNHAGIYAASIAGLVKSARRFRPDSTAPALLFTTHLAADFLDGRLDLQRSSGVALGDGAPTYTTEVLWNQGSTRTGMTTAAIGDADFASRVVKIKRAPRSAEGAAEGETLLSNGRLLTTLRDPNDSTKLITLEAAPELRFVDVDASQFFSAAVSEAGDVYTRIDQDQAWTLQIASAANPVTSLTVSGDCLFVRRANGTLTRTEVTSNDENCLQVNGAFPTNVTSIYSGRPSNYVVDSQRRLLAWGEHARDLGIGVNSDERVLDPSAVVGIGDILMMYPWSPDASADGASGGFGQTGYALTVDGHLYAWGAPNAATNTPGTFNPVTDRNLTPVLIQNLPPICWVGGAYAVACNGDLYYWSATVTPRRAENITNVWRVIAPTSDIGSQSTIAITRDGRTFSIRRTSVNGVLTLVITELN